MSSGTRFRPGQNDHCAARCTPVLVCTDCAALAGVQHEDSHLRPPGDSVIGWSWRRARIALSNYPFGRPASSRSLRSPVKRSLQPYSPTGDLDGDDAAATGQAVQLAGLKPHAGAGRRRSEPDRSCRRPGFSFE
jgi:hypothetical protein